MTLSQLALPLVLDDHAAFATLVDGRNGAAFAHARSLPAAPRGDILWLWGPRGAGKSHVLQAACREADAAGKRAMYVPLGTGPPIEPGLLTGLDALELLALDGVDRVAGTPRWEGPLFEVLNGFQTRERSLLIAADSPPGAVPFRLADLKSRAAASVVYRLHPLDDESDRREALRRHARRRGLELSPAAARFLQARVPRDMPSLCAWLERLDAESLAAQRRITIPFIRAALAATGDDG